MEIVVVQPHKVKVYLMQWINIWKKYKNEYKYKFINN